MTMTGTSERERISRSRSSPSSRTGCKSRVTRRGSQRVSPLRASRRPDAATTCMFCRLRNSMITPLHGRIVFDDQNLHRLATDLAAWRKACNHCTSPIAVVGGHQQAARPGHRVAARDLWPATADSWQEWLLDKQRTNPPSIVKLEPVM